MKNKTEECFENYFLLLNTQYVPHFLHLRHKNQDREEKFSLRSSDGVQLRSSRAGRNTKRLQHQQPRTGPTKLIILT